MRFVSCVDRVRASQSVVAQRPMITIGCAGFPVPATRYFPEFSFVEIQEAYVATPGMGSMRRWRREAGSNFDFSVVVPRNVMRNGLRDGAIVETELQAVTDVVRELRASTVVFLAPLEWEANEANRDYVTSFLLGVRGRFSRVVWEAPLTWDCADATEVATRAGAVAAYDPLVHGVAPGKLGYYRLPGPVGHKSRYEDVTMDTVVKAAQRAQHDEALYVFTNVDMMADAKRLKKFLIG